jgi:molybdopterin-binding protein
MKLSARDGLRGKVATLTKGATTAHAEIEIAGGAVFESSGAIVAVD